MPARKKRLRLTKNFPFIKFGSSAAEHSEQATQWVNGTRDAAKAVTRAASKGQCSVALHELIVMNRKWGSAITAHQGAGNTRKFPNGVSEQVESAEKVFASNCLSSGRARPNGTPKLRLVGARRR